jgi:hypothetical protein
MSNVKIDNKGQAKIMPSKKILVLGVVSVPGVPLSQILLALKPVAKSFGYKLEHDEGLKPKANELSLAFPVGGCKDLEGFSHALCRGLKIIGLDCFSEGKGRAQGVYLLQFVKGPSAQTLPDAGAKKEAEAKKAKARAKWDEAHAEKTAEPDPEPEPAPEPTPAPEPEPEPEEDGC